jgi:transcriptional regulator with AAA-type ATPase domain/predicted ATPase
LDNRPSFLPRLRVSVTILFNTLRAMDGQARELIGSNSALRKLLDTARTVAPRPEPVLLTGETGTGKGLLAETLHRLSGRGGPLVAVNCAALPPNLVESELFGHERGAFTGAERSKPGLFEQAQRGTLFLDEIGEAPAAVQAKLLRAIEEGLVRRVGGREEIPVNVRLLCATNRDLRRADNGFREDLYFRIATFVLELPPLRERGDDALLLAREFLRGSGKRLSPRAVKLIAAYPWPGNVRELRSCLSYASAMAGDARAILPEHLPPVILSPPALRADGQPETVRCLRELQAAGFDDRRLWAQFLLALHEQQHTAFVTRKDMTALLRALRGAGPSDNSLVNDWQRKLKPAAVGTGLLRAEGLKHRIELEACRAALSQPAQVPVPAPVAPSQGFVGREVELARLAALRRPGALVTVLGPGGTGKTRLVNEFRLHAPGPSCFIDLTEARDLEGLANEVARALGVAPQAGQNAVAAVGAALQVRPGLLLVLDNLEQAVQAARQAVSVWLGQAPGLCCMVTSRELLGLEGEQALELQPLPIPPDAAGLEDLHGNESVRLFLQRAQQAQPGFRLEAANAPAVSAICREVEGMPLALELAAARVGVLAPPQLLERLHDRLAVLRGGRRDLPARHQSLAATVQWSIDLLPPHEREVLAQLSVFRGGFTLEAAEAVVRAQGEVLDVLQALRDKSLLRSRLDGETARLGLYRAVWEAADDLLRVTGDGTDLRARHMRHFLEFAEPLAARLQTPEAPRAIERLESERQNLYAAHDFALSHAEPPEAARLSLALNVLLQVRGPMSEQLARLQDASAMLPDPQRASRALLRSELARALYQSGDLPGALACVEDALHDAAEGPPAVRGEALLSRSVLYYRTGRMAESLVDADAACDLLAAGGHPASCGRAMGRMALALSAMGRRDEALARCQEAREMLERAGDLHGLALNLAALGIMLHERAEHAASAQAFHDAQQTFERFGDRRGAAGSMVNRALQAQALGRLEDALALTAESARRGGEIGDRHILASACTHRGIVLFELGMDAEALTCVREAEGHARAIGQNNTLAVALEYQAMLLARRGDLHGALRLFREIDGLDGVSESVRGGVDASLAEVLLGAGRHDEALRCFERACKRGAMDDASRAQPRFQALVLGARLHAVTGRREEARQLAAQAADLAKGLGISEQGPGRRSAEAMRALRPLL